MGKLTDPQKRFIVKSLACRKTADWIIEQAKSIWKINVFKSQVYYYDPDKGGHLGAIWKALHRETREAYVREIESIPVAHEGYRLRLIQEALDELFGGKLKLENLSEAMKLLEQAARERGGSYTNARRLANRAGDDVPLPGVVAPTGIFVIGPPEINDMVAKKATPFVFGDHDK